MSIDEIQDSPEVYGKIRSFAREFCCDFIVTGSYLGKTREKEFFQAAGDVNFLTMTGSGCGLFKNHLQGGEQQV